MAITYDFFKSVASDRDLPADRFANRFRAFIKEGVIVSGTTVLSTELEVTANDTDLDVEVALGGAIIQGYFVDLSTAETLTLSAGDSVNPRIDRIVLTLDINDGVRSIALSVLEGTPGAVPVAPTLTRDLTGSLIHQVSLAQILVLQSAALILDSNVTDERSGTSTCGVANIDLKINPATATDAASISVDDSAFSVLTGTNVQDVLDDVDDVFVTLSSLSVISKSTTYTATTSDNVILCTGTFTVTLPTAVGNTGKEFNIKNVSTGTITIDGDGTETIDGNTTLDITVQNDSYRLISDGANWRLI